MVVFCGFAWAPGALAAQFGPLRLAGGMTVVAQAADDRGVEAEVTASFDLFGDVPVGPGTLHVYVEAATTPRIGGVSCVLGEVNADAGTALSRREQGRVQLSEVRLVWPLDDDVAGHVGLIDATGFLDVSDIANDERLSFLGVPFVNNPTIEFPDYSLGAAVEGAMGAGGRLRFVGVVASSHGLADNPGVSYAQLLDVGSTGKGVFTGAAVRWVEDGRRLSVGAWHRNALVQTIHGPDGRSQNMGLFSVAELTRGVHGVSARAGVTNGRVSLAGGFLGLAYRWDRGPHAVGVATGRSFGVSEPGIDDVSHHEAFLRRRLSGGTWLTVGAQRIVNPGFDGSGETVAARSWVGSLRFSASF